MPTLPIPLVGPTYQNRSLPVNNQHTQNFYIEVNKQGGEPVSLMPFPGLKSFATTGVGVDRGMGEHAGVAYKVTGNTLYSLAIDGTATPLGTIPGSNRCKLFSDGVVLVITYGTGKPITWNTVVLTIGTDVDLANSDTGTYINRRVVYDGSGTALIFADLDKALVVNSLNNTSVNTSPTNVLAVETQAQQIIVFGEKSITPYYFSGTGNPPYKPIQNGTKKTGLKAIHSLAQDNDFIYFLDNKLRVCRYAGLQIQNIGNPAISRAIASYTNPQDAIGETFTLDNQNFYYLTFPNNASWLFTENVGWTSLAYGTKGAPHLISSYLNIYGKHLVADRRNGNVYELDFETFTDNGDVIQHQRVTSKIDGKTFGKPGARVFMDRLEIIVEGGTSLITGQGSNATIMMSFSDDGGNTFSSEDWESIGTLGDYGLKIEWFDLGDFYNRIFRFRMSDPVKWVLISLHADVDLDNG